MRHLQSSKSPASFSPTIPYPGVPLPPLGPSGQFPSFIGTVGRSDSLPSIPLHFVSFIPRYRRDALASLQRITDIGVRRPGLFSRSPKTGSFRRRRQDLPGSLTNPNAYMPLFLDPGGACSQARTTARCCLPLSQRRRPPRCGLFGARSQRPTRSLSTLRSAGYPDTTQDSLPAGGSSLCRAGFDPLGPNRKVSLTMSRCVYIMLPPSQGFPWRNET